MAKYTKYIALDFGTSGCAISLGFAEPDPNSILVYGAWNELKVGLSLKCPSILLVDPSKKFEKFGEEAFKAYNKLSKDDVKRYYYFYRFKMKLYRSPDATTITAANGEQLPAIDVFAMTLQFLKDTALRWCKSFDKVKWIVTVPAIWSDAAKEMMRKASDKVGLVKDLMMLVNEPEAAALFCQYDFLKQQHFSSYEKSYLVVDCGGGTVDIAAHKMVRQGNNTLIHELFPPCGGEWGGFAVNDQFEMLLQNIFKMSKDNFVKLKENYSMHWNKLINNDFEGSKLQVDPEKPVPLTVNIAKSVRREISKITGKNIEDLVQAYGNKDIEWDDDDRAIVLNYPAILQLFKPVIDEIYSLINNVLTSNGCQCISAVLMVGGFANSKVLFADIKARLKSHYPNIEIYCSSDPTFSVVKGAVLTAQLKNIIDTHLQNADSTSSLTSQLGSLSMQATATKSASPSAVSTSEVTKYLPFVVSRKMKYTIGVETNVLFEVGEHDSDKKYFYGGQHFCKNVFNPLVKANESVYIGSSKKTFRFRPLTEEQSTCDITIFATEKENVKYVDDPDCYVRAQVVISNLPRYNTDLSREVEICIDFYETECEISAYSVTAKEHKKVTVDYHFLPNKYLPPST